ncbi:hypothetical protein Tco_0774042 [Tanacetum coccineum]|uniref:Uncharacterized protein n=1 Tax=Tanacetum coccineum TaxID=301880 RepID=A0ABQ4ZPL9_9ASTR
MNKLHHTPYMQINPVALIWIRGTWNSLNEFDLVEIDWTSHSEEEEDYALMACNSSGSDTEKVEAQLVAHQQGQLWYEEKIRFMKIDLDDKTDVLTYHKKLLAEAQKEKEDLKAKVEKWHNSSKNLGKLLNTQMSANDKFGLGYGDHRYDGILSYENEVLQSVFMNKESELEKQPLYDRFVTAGGMHAVPPPMTGNYMPSGPDVEIDYSQFTYGPNQSQPSESETQTSDFDTCESDCSVETHESLPEPTVNKPKVVSEPKVWSDAPIIEEYESDSEDEHVSQPTKEQEQPSFASTNKQVKTPRETIKNQFSHSKNPNRRQERLDMGFLLQEHVLYVVVNTARASGTNNVSTARQDFNRQKWEREKRERRERRRENEEGKKEEVNMGTCMFSGVGFAVVVVSDIPHRALKAQSIIDSEMFLAHDLKQGYLLTYQDFNGALMLLEEVTGPQKLSQCRYKRNIDAVNLKRRMKSAQDCFVLPIWSSYYSTVKRSKEKDAGTEKDANDGKPEALRKDLPKKLRTILPLMSTNPCQETQIPALEDIYQNPTDGIFTNSSYDDEGAVADFTNLEPIMNILPYGKKAIGTKWVYRNKKDERGVWLEIKQGLKPSKRFLAFASYMGS